MDITQLLDPTQIMISYVLLGLISILRATPRVPNWVIPWIIMVLAAAANGAANHFTLSSILVGTILGFGTTGIHISFTDLSNVLNSNVVQSLGTLKPVSESAPAEDAEQTYTSDTVLQDPSQVLHSL